MSLNILDTSIVAFPHLCDHLTVITHEILPSCSSVYRVYFDYVSHETLPSCIYIFMTVSPCFLAIFHVVPHLCNFYVTICLCFSWYLSSLILICLWLLNCVFSWIQSSCIFIYLNFSSCSTYICYMIDYRYLFLQTGRIIHFRKNRNFIHSTIFIYILFIFWYYPKHHEYDACKVLWKYPYLPFRYSSFSYLWNVLFSI